MTPMIDWSGLRALPREWREGDIEYEPLRVLECSAKPAGLWKCSDLHPHRGCNGTGSLRGASCQGCGGTGIGQIRKGDRVYCPRCHETGFEDDPRLIVRPGQMPRPEPKPPAEPLMKPKGKPKAEERRKPGRPKGSKDTKPRRKRRTTPA